jgi:hypothetical protein
VAKDVTIGAVGGSADTSLQDFTFTKGGAFSGTFKLDDDGIGGTEACTGGNCSNQQTISDLLPGTYTVAEALEFGWQLQNISCAVTTSAAGGPSTFTYTGFDSANGFQDGDNTANITLKAGELITCTFTNHQADMPLVKLINGIEPTNCSGTFPNQICKDPNAPTVDLPQFLVTLSGGFIGSPVTVPVPPRFSAPGFIGASLTLCEAVPVGWKLLQTGDVKIYITGGTGDTQPNPALPDLTPTVNQGTGVSDRCVTFTIPNGTDEYRIEINNLRIGLTIVKKVKKIEYEYVVTNIGSTGITNLSVVDDTAAGESCLVTTLAAGASTTCSATYTAQPATHQGTITNIAHAEGTDPASSTVTSPSDTLTTTWAP